jgi:hypothetical protein
MCIVNVISVLSYHTQKPSFGFNLIIDLRGRTKVTKMRVAREEESLNCHSNDKSIGAISDTGVESIGKMVK